MQNREQILGDYFKLRVLLNRTNLNSNQKTELEFLILSKDSRNYSFVATLAGVKDAKHLELCRRGQRGRWSRSEHSGLWDLEGFCVRFLENNMSADPTHEEMLRLARDIKITLQGLGIPR